MIRRVRGASKDRWATPRHRWALLGFILVFGCPRSEEQESGSKMRAVDAGAIALPALSRAELLEVIRELEGSDQNIAKELRLRLAEAGENRRALNSLEEDLRRALAGKDLTATGTRARARRNAVSIVSILSNPSGARVFIAEREVGKTPYVRKGPVGVRKLSVRVEREAYASWRGEILANEAGHFVLNVVLVEE